MTFFDTEKNGALRPAFVENTWRAFRAHGGVSDFREDVIDFVILHDPVLGRTICLQQNPQPGSLSHWPSAQRRTAEQGPGLVQD